MFLLTFKDPSGTLFNLLVQGADDAARRDDIKDKAWEAVHEHGWYDDESYTDWTAEQIVDKLKSAGYQVEVLTTHDLELRY